VIEFVGGVEVVKAAPNGLATAFLHIKVGKGALSLSLPHRLRPGFE
jgi:hypothetical protein